MAGGLGSHEIAPATSENDQPMNGHLLLNWLTDRASGPWETFREAVETLSEQNQIAPSPGRLANDLSDLAIARFFIDGTRRWTVFAPLLGGLGDGQQAVLVGGRTTSLTESLLRVCHEEGIDAEEIPLRHGFRQLRVTAHSPGQLERIAVQLGIPFEGALSRRLCRSIRSMPEEIGCALAGVVPYNWSVRSFDFSELAWVDGDVGSTAIEYTARSGIHRYMVRDGNSLLQMEKHSAVYAAAYVRGVSMLRYDIPTRSLVVPARAPLPESMARIASMCDGRVEGFVDGAMVY